MKMDNISLLLTRNTKRLTTMRTQLIKHNKTKMMIDVFTERGTRDIL